MSIQLSLILTKKISLLPDNPGSYQMKDNSNNIIYVGKAKSLKKRVSQYFTRPQEGKVARMVEEIADFDIIETQNEQEALLLEINLIHKYRPKYNIALMDDKTYPYIALNKCDDPYLKIVRKPNSKNYYYFGPYPDSSKAYKMITLLNKLFPLRKCTTIKNSPCMYYYLGQCLAPCKNKITKEQYSDIINKITTFLNGNTKEVISEQKIKMKEFSKNLEFEKASECKNTIDMINKITTKQKIIFQDKIDRDVIGYSTREGFICIYFLKYKKGLLFDKSYKIADLEDDIDSILERTIIEKYINSYDLPKEVILSSAEAIKVLNNYKNIKFIKPSRGNKFDMLALAAKNASQMLDTHFQTARLKDNVLELLDQLKNILHLEKTPLVIELYDNSHLQGYDPVGVMVKYINGEKSPKHYRRYKINGENSKDDLASMKEVLTRRLSKFNEENDIHPDLILMDGGEEQCKVALEVLNDLNLNITVAGLKKNDKHQTSTLINAALGEEVELDKKSPLFFLLTRMQDEVHRFAITFHKERRSKSLFKTIYDDIEGIGSKRKQMLLDLYPTLESIQEATEEELLQILPSEVVKTLKMKVKDLNSKIQNE